MLRCTKELQRPLAKTVPELITALFELSVQGSTPAADVDKIE